jgi:hypothetical protein
MSSACDSEYAEFLLPAYRWLISSAVKVNDTTIELVLNDTSKAKVVLSDDMAIPPRIWRNGVELLSGGLVYTPATPAARWMVTLLH